jgi:uncharacterized protein (TIGR02246 family)
MSAVGELAAVARSYFDKVRARDPAAVAGMFAEDGVLGLPDGTRHRGRTAIEAFYVGLFAVRPPTPTVKATVCEGRRCLVELVAKQPGGVENAAADVFTFDEVGLIAELVIYARAGG